MVGRTRRCRRLPGAPGRLGGRALLRRGCWPALPDGLPLGAAYGWVGPPELRGAPLPGIAEDHVFHVGDVTVAAGARRAGLGRRLLDRVVTGRRPAAVVTHPDSGARHLYDAAGWTRAGTVEPPGGPALLTYILR